MTATMLRALGQSLAFAPVRGLGGAPWRAVLPGRCRFVLALTLTLAACHERSTNVARIIGSNGTDAGNSLLPLGPSGGSGGRGGDGGLTTDAAREIGTGGLCTADSLLTDPRNCGTCGTVCSIPHGQAACVGGRCTVGTCNPGYVDLDTNPGNGCECVQSNGGVEICDGKDNNCDGQIDETFDLMSDVANCGQCATVCGAAHATGHCVRGACSFDCLPGYSDADGKPENGCELTCTLSNNGVEICDGKDNDCNGIIDGNPTDVGQSCGIIGCQPGVLTCIAGARVCVGAGQPSPEVCDGRDNDCNGIVDDNVADVGKACYPAGAEGCNLLTGTCVGACRMGAWACTDGVLLCSGAATPRLEVCDGKDNDCDGAIDEDFNLQTDARHCGSCDKACSYPHAVAVCSNARCQIGSCLEGWVDADHDASNGCEYGCTPDGPEVCDGKDNDCNGLTDGDDPGLVYPVVNFCRQNGECGKGPGGSTHFPGDASFPVCSTPSGASTPSWSCNYPATVQLSGPNQLVAQESWCDGLDNDCDGAVDEFASATLGTPCSDNTGLGECRRAGTVKCQPDKTLAPACDLSGPVATAPTDEICDGKDNDCDGLIDESWDNPAGLGLTKCTGGQECKGVRDAVVHVTATAAPGGGYYIYSYEASRPDSSATSAGTASTRACSRAGNVGGGGVLPWSSVTWVGADAACRAAGMRLCKVARSNDTVTADEWGFACSLGKTCTSGCYPYGETYDSSRCNGAEASHNAATTVGSSSQCTTSGDLDPASTGEAVFDLSGNLAEWTDDPRGTLADGRQIYTCRGGAYDSYSVGLGCTFMATVVAQNFSYPDTGFRCCSSCAPGLADCNGACVNLGTDNANCGACGTKCTGPATCQNGSCK